MDWVIANKEWLFSGVLIAVPLAIIGWFYKSTATKQIQKAVKGTDAEKALNTILGKKDTTKTSTTDTTKATTPVTVPTATEVKEKVNEEAKKKVLNLLKKKGN